MKKNYVIINNEYKKVWYFYYLPYVEGVYHTRVIETFTNANAHMVRMVHTKVSNINVTVSIKIIKIAPFMNVASLVI